VSEASLKLQPVRNRDKPVASLPLRLEAILLIRDDGNCPMLQWQHSKKRT
jgi:hypothetical protein